MADVNTRIQSFYYKGREAAANEVIDFLDRGMVRFKDSKLPADTTLGEVLIALRRAMVDVLGVDPGTRDDKND